MRKLPWDSGYPRHQGKEQGIIRSLVASSGSMKFPIGTAIKILPVQELIRFCYRISCRSFWCNKTNLFIFRWTAGQTDNRVGTHIFLVLSLSSLDGGVYVLCQRTDHKQHEILKDKTLYFSFSREEQHFDHVWCNFSFAPLCACLIFQLMSDHRGSRYISEAPCWPKVSERGSENARW